MSCVSSAVGGRDPGESDGATPSGDFFFASRPKSDSFRGVAGFSEGAGAGAEAGADSSSIPASSRSPIVRRLALNSSARSGQKYVARPSWPANV